MKYFEIIKEIRETKGYSQEDLAQILEVNQTTIGQWENGKKKPNFDNMLNIYKKFNITPNELMGIDELNPDTLEINIERIKIKQTKRR